jgi:hypothetical protein
MLTIPTKPFLLFRVATIPGVGHPEPFQMRRRMHFCT